MTIDHEGRPIPNDDMGAYSTQPDLTQTSGADGGGAKDKAKEVASVASGQTAEVANTAKAATKDVASQAASQASAVAGQAKEQIHSVVGQAKGELQTQAQAKGEQAAVALRSLSEQMTALSQGRPGEAGQLQGLLGEAQTRVQSFADRLESSGPQGFVEDLTSFARRRPGAFLFAAGVAGFAVGRTVRAGTAANKEGLMSSSQPVMDEYAAPAGLPAPQPLTTMPVGEDMAYGGATTDAFAGDSSLTGDYASGTFTSSALSSEPGVLGDPLIEETT